MRPLQNHSPSGSSISSLVRGLRPYETHSSSMGDGFFFVALAYVVYEISNVPTAMSLVGVPWTLPLVLFMLVGGVFSDRYDRRWLMIGDHLIRAAAIGLLGVLSISGVLEIWHVIALIAVVGIGDAFFNPADGHRPGPRAEEAAAPGQRDGQPRPYDRTPARAAVGGLTVAAVGSGAAFLVDAASFLASAAAVAAIVSPNRTRRRAQRPAGTARGG